MVIWASQRHYDDDWNLTWNVMVAAVVVETVEARNDGLTRIIKWIQHFWFFVAVAFCNSWDCVEQRLSASVWL